MPPERAEKKRGEKQSAAETAAKRDHGRDRLQDEHGGNHGHRDRDKSGKVQRAMPRRHHLRRQQGEQPHHQTAQRRAQRRPDPGLRQKRLAQRDAAHDGDAEQRRQHPEHCGDGKVMPEDVADRSDADAERQHRKRMGDEIAGDGGDADRGQAGRGISADHEFKGIERAGERCAERARDRGRGAASDHDALVGAAQMKSAAQRGAEPAGQLGVSCFKPDRGADAAGPHRLQRHDHAAAERHPPAMQRIGLDRIDFPRRPPPLQQQERQPQQQPAETRDQQRPQRIDAELAGKPIPHLEIEQHHMEPFDRGAHRRHHQAADGADQGRQHDQARFHGRERMPAAGAAPQDNGKWMAICWVRGGPEVAVRPRFSGVRAGHASRARPRRRIRPPMLFTIPSRCL